MLLKLIQGVRQFKGKIFKELEDLFIQLSKGQNPDILFITCSDSRIIPSVLTQSQPGDLFIMRNIGNIIPPYPHPYPCSEAAAIEYAVDVLHVKEIVVCGHSQCGAMQGLLNPNLEQTLPAVAKWLSHAKPALEQVNSKFAQSSVDPSIKLRAAIEFNIQVQIEHLKTYPSVLEKLKRHEMTLYGWYYELETGNVFIYESATGQFLPAEDFLNQAIESKVKRITQKVVMDYLDARSCPKTATDYLKLMDLFNQLKTDTQSIWDTIYPRLAEQIWQELGFLFSSPTDSNFIEVVNSAATIKPNDLNALQSNVEGSRGYQEYCRQLLLTSRFFMPAPIKQVTSVDALASAGLKLAK